MTYKLIVAPSEEPVSIAEARVQCSLDDATFDTLLASLIQAAREQAEHITGRAFCTQTWELVQDGFPEACVLRHAPVQSLTSVWYLDSTGVERYLDAADTILDRDSAPGYLVPGYGKAWPETYAVPNCVRVRYVCGYGGAAAVPSAAKHWMLLAIGTLFAQRETFIAGQVSSLPDGFWNHLLDSLIMYECM